MEDKEEKPRIIIPKEALVPFANPLADDKQMKKLLKSVKKGIHSLSRVHWAQISAREISISRTGDFRSKLRQLQATALLTNVSTQPPKTRP